LPKNFWPKTTWLSHPSTLLYSVSLIEDKIERPPFWHNLGARGRIAGGAEHPHRTWLPECILKMAEALERCQRAEEDCLEGDADVGQ
jgi:hypothetical protein